MPITVKGDKALIKDLDRVKKGLATDKLLNKIGSTAKARILVRTNKGMDYKGRAFVPYEPVTVQIRRSRGRQTGHVDLQMERHMLNSMQVKTDNTKNLVKIVFSRRTEREKAFKHNEVGVGRKKTKREFFSLGKKMENEIFKLYEKQINRLIK